MVCPTNISLAQEISGGTMTLPCAGKEEEGDHPKSHSPGGGGGICKHSASTHYPIQPSQRVDAAMLCVQLAHRRYPVNVTGETGTGNKK